MYETMPLLSLLLLCSSFFVQHVHSKEAKEQVPLHDNSLDCKCYATEGENSTTDYFLYHRFYDFRQLPVSIDAYGTAPAVPANSALGNRDTLADPDSLNTTKWNQDWEIQDWSKGAGEDAPIPMQNSLHNVYISRDNQSVAPSPSGKTRIDPPSNYLVLRTFRMGSFQSVAEIDNNQKNVLHGSLRFRARVRGAPGAVAGLFTYYDDDNESDIEILTADPETTYRFTNQPATKKGDDVPQASRKMEGLPSWKEWHDHRIDWLPGVTRWYIDGNFVVENQYSVPRKPSQVVLNVWSNGGEWSGEMSVGDQAQLQVQWVQVAFNTSGKRDGPGGGKHKGTTKRSLEKRGKGCTTVCKVDGVQRVGYPEVTFSSAAVKIGSGLSFLISVGPLVALLSHL